MLWFYEILYPIDRDAHVLICSRENSEPSRYDIFQFLSQSWEAGKEGGIVPKSTLKAVELNWNWNSETTLESIDDWSWRFPMGRLNQLLAHLGGKGWYSDPLCFLHKWTFRPIHISGLAIAVPARCKISKVKPCKQTIDENPHGLWQWKPHNLWFQKMIWKYIGLELHHVASPNMLLSRVPCDTMFVTL